LVNYLGKIGNHDLKEKITSLLFFPKNKEELGGKL